MSEVKRINRRKVFEGIVISDKMMKTRVVQVRWGKKHPVYEKILRSATKYKVHDEKNESKTGDVVRIMETRPLSKEKRWLITEIISKSSEGAK
ncbi:MAG: 30S ribosomal protein S17 [Candidatus Omnitrophica bacterium]|nr:30S ribosomal protein S17 [Candidatus Omnitrophota bacterium]